jgi:Ser/Thr protein kinase RdoA (MazF antagonist)
LENIFSIASHFDLDGSIESIRSHGSGNVNDTYLVTLQDRTGHTILQRVNTYVFKNPKLVMRNMRRDTEHLQACVQEDRLDWKVQQVISSKNGDCFWVSDDGDFWRMISYIENSESFDAIYSHEQAYEIGFSLGLFHEHINRIETQVFDTVLPGFHVTPGYLDAFDLAIAESDREIDDELRFAMHFIEANRENIGILEDGKKKGMLPQRVIHGDPKANNIMFDKSTAKAISVIDLDTIQPGLVHYDIGDCIRSSCNPLGEEPGVQWRDTTFDLLSFRYVLDGYLQRGSRFLSEEEYDYIYDAVFLMTFELGLRFLTDYLHGDVYYKIHFPSQNKYRALTQFKLAHEIQNNQGKIKKIITELQYR